MPDGFFAVRQPVVDALAHDREQVALHIRRNVFSQNISAERQRQTRLALPPFAEVHDFREPCPGISELAFVNDKPRIRFAAFHRIEDLIERHDDVFEVTEVKLEREIRARHFPRDGNRPVAQ